MDAHAKPLPTRPAEPAGAGQSYPREGGSNPAAGEDWSRLARVGLYGGSFDPVHLGHVHVAETGQAARGLERVVFVPAAESPHKPGQLRAEGRDRVAMLELALRGRRTWSIDELELARPGPSYTIDTLRAVRARWGLSAEARIYLLLGSDNLELFGRWKDARAILELAEVVVVPRERELGPRFAQLAREHGRELAAALERAVVAGAILPVSSSDIRAALERGEPCDGLLPGAVREYIAARGIYRPRGGALPRG